MTAPLLIRENEGFTLTESVVTSVAAVATLDGIDAVKPHCFLGVKLWEDAAGTVAGTLAAGTFEVEVKTINSDPNFEEPPTSSIPADGPTSINWGANTMAVRVTPTTTSGGTALWYQVSVTCNET